MKANLKGFFGAQTKSAEAPTAPSAQEPAAPPPQDTELPSPGPEPEKSEEVLRTADFVTEPHSGPPAPEPLPPLPQPKGGRVLAVVALTLSLGAAAGVGYIYTTSQKTQARLMAELTNTKGTMEATLGTWGQKLAKQEKQRSSTESAPLDELRSKQESLTAIINEKLLPHMQGDNTAQTLAELKAVVAEISATVRTNSQGTLDQRQSLEDRLIKLDKQITDAKTDWESTRKQVRILCEVAHNQETAIRGIEDNLNQSTKK